MTNIIPAKHQHVSIVIGIYLAPSLAMLNWTPSISPGTYILKEWLKVTVMNFWTGSETVSNSYWSARRLAISISFFLTLVFDAIGSDSTQNQMKSCSTLAHSAQTPAQPPAATSHLGETQIRLFSRLRPAVGSSEGRWRPLESGSLSFEPKQDCTGQTVRSDCNKIRVFLKGFWCSETRLLLSTETANINTKWRK